MNKKLQFKSLILLVALLLGGAGSAWSNDVTGTINFGNAQGSTKIEGKTSSGTGTVTYTDSGDDNLGNTWTITTITKKSKSFTQNSNYSQIGKASDPVTSITFTTTLPSSQTIKSFSAKFGGFGNTQGTISLKVGNTEVGSGSLNGTNDVTVTSTNTTSVSGTVLTVTVTNIAKGVKCYYISYTYDDGKTLTKPTISFPNDSCEVIFGDDFTAPKPTCNSDGAKTYSSDNEDVATVNPSTGAVTINKIGSAKITLSVAESSTYEAGTASYTLIVKGAIVDGVFDFSIGQDYGSNLKQSSVTVQTSTWVAGNVTMVASGRNCWYTDKKTFRVYKANDDGGAGTLVFSVPEGTEGTVITKIVFTGSNLGDLEDADGKYSASTSTWEGASNRVTLSAKASATTIQIETITVTYGNPPAVEKPESSVASGAYTETQSVKLTCATAGAKIYYTTNGSEPSAESTEYTGPITVSETTTIKAIAITSAGSSSILEISITLPTIYNTIAALIAAEPKETVILNLTNAQVLAVGSSDMYVKDASGAIDFYSVKLPYTAGQVLNGSITVTEFKYYNTMPEVSKIGNYNLTATDGTLTPVEVSSTSEVTLSDYMCKLVKVTGMATGDSKIDNMLMYSGLGLTDTNLKAFIPNVDNITVTGIVKPYKSGDNFLTEIVPTAISYNITLTGNLMTYCTSNKLDFTESGLKVYSAKVENGAAKLTELPDNENGLKVVNYSRGVILAGTAGQTYTVPMTTEKVSTLDTEMFGVKDDTEVAYNADSKYNYILQGGVFKKATGATLKAGKAYLSTKFNVEDPAAAARELKIVFDGETTGIKAIETANNKSVYDLQGRKVAAPTKGLYIINGKKMIVK